MYDNMFKLLKKSPIVKEKEHGKMFENKKKCSKLGNLCTIIQRYEKLRH